LKIEEINLQGIMAICALLQRMGILALRTELFHTRKECGCVPGESDLRRKMQVLRLRKPHVAACAAQDDPVLMDSGFQ
jgi:hypothetical protein